jgi:hypothetical protein
MKITYRVYHCKDFIKTSVSGELDLEGSKKALKTLAEDPRYPDDYEILIDLRDADCHLEVYEIYDLCQYIGRYRLSFLNKIAVVVSDDGHFDKAKFMELFAGNRGFDIRTFTNISEAKKWLGTEVSN